MKNNPLVTVIVPVYNCEKYIARCIESVINQTYSNIELIIVNDGSTDHTNEICENYNKKYQNIKLINQKNQGVSIARNNALNISLGQYIQFTDSDDYMEKDMIELMVKSAITNNSDIVICEYSYEYEKGFRKKVNVLKDYFNLSFKDLISDEKTKYGGFPWNKLIKRECITNLYNTNLNYYENLVFFLDNAKNINTYSVVHIPLYNYFINSNSALHNKKYNIKRITALDALSLVIDIVDEDYKDLYKYYYISQLAFNKKEIKKNKLNFDLSQYINQSLILKKELLKRNNLNFKTKIKLLIKSFL